MVELAAALGDRYDHSVISRVESGKTALRLDGLTKAAVVLNVSIDYLTGLTDDPTPAAVLADRVETSMIPQQTDEISGTRQVEVRELAAAAGGGAGADDERVVGRVAFRRTWLDRHGLDPKSCTVIGVMGESMDPTLPEGCSILVDRDHKGLRDGRIFVVRTDDGLVVKRAGKDQSGDWLMLSDNDSPDWPPLPWPQDAKVIGEVKWMARTL